MDTAPTALAPAPEEFAQTPQESQDLETKTWYERWIAHQQEPRPLKSTNAEDVELMWKLRPEQQRTAAQAGAAKGNGNGNGQNQKKKRRLIYFK
jgi:hypothetical protein